LLDGKFESPGTRGVISEITQEESAKMSRSLQQPSLFDFRKRRIDTVLLKRGTP
jgi:hypothetical protein